MTNKQKLEVFRAAKDITINDAAGVKVFNKKYSKSGFALQPNGLCLTLKGALAKSGIHIELYCEITDYLPEFSKDAFADIIDRHNEKETAETLEGLGAYWLPRDNVKGRLEIIDKLINETKEKIKDEKEKRRRASAS